MRGLEGGADGRRRAEIDDEVGVGFSVAQAQPAADGAGFHALIAQRVANNPLKSVAQRARGAEAAGAQRLLQPRLTHHAHARLADPPGRQHAGVTRTEDFVDTEDVGHLTRHLAAGPAEGQEGVIPRVEPTLGRHAGNGGRHLLDGDGQKAFRRRFSARGAHGGRQLGQPCAGVPDVEGRAPARTEHRWKSRRIDPTQEQIGVGDRGRAASTVGGRAGIGAGAGRTDPGAQAVEGEDGAAAGGDGLDVEHGRAHRRAGDRGAGPALQGAGETTHVG